ncbi:FAD-binding protein [Antribacter gilvus]|uniref:FAD-binding protein n=1 Tax=Antribacter gilvus TaxID=2304675 RepID=UPI000F7AB64E|nr:FAD-binding protein [Antribacter gilvus]
MNWAGNLTYSAERVARPRSLDELGDLLAAGGRVRALGSRHSFSDVADTTGVHVQVDAVDDGRPPVDLDPATGVVSVNGGLRHGEVATALHAQGRALSNLASLPHISVAGAVATATHGSGDRNRSLASDVVGLELVTVDGGRRTLRRGDADFPGAVVSLGALGIVTRVELATRPTFDVRQDVLTDLPWDALLENFDAVTGSAYSVSLFTGGAEPTVRQVWRKAVQDGDQTGVGQREGDDDVLVALGAKPAPGPLHPIPGVDPLACTAQLGVPGPWHERLPHFRLDFTPSAGDELQSEFLVPRTRAVAAIEAVRRLASVVAPLLLTTEIRTVAADDLWLSPFDEDCVGIHFTWVADWPAVRAVLPRIEDTLLPLGARPHWGKLSTVPAADVAALFPGFAAFRELAHRLDPEGRLRGGYVERLLAD